MARLLLVDEEAKTLNILSTLLRTEGYKIVPVLGLAKAEAFTKSQHFDLILVDLSGNPDAGADVLRAIRGDKPNVPIIAIHDKNYQPPDSETDAVKDVSWFLKPLKIKEFLLAVQKLVDYMDAGSDTYFGRMVSEIEGVSNDIVAVSPAMRLVCSMIKRVAPTEIAILIHGEQGLEKEDVARVIHESSLCSKGRFVRFDCSSETDSGGRADAILFGSGKTGDGHAENQGLFEQSNGGTLFLDGVDVLPPDIQKKINDFLHNKKVRRGDGGQDIPVKVRVIASAGKNPEAQVRAGTFDADLYKTLSIMPVQIKPLRERREDIIPLIELFLQDIGCAENRSLSCDDKTLDILERYQWPGNTRELRETLRYAAEHASGSVITHKDLPPSLADAGVSTPG